MRLGYKEFNDECANCGNVLECELCKQGHGIGMERTNITQMVKCQMEHERKRNGNAESI